MAAPLGHHARAMHPRLFVVLAICACTAVHPGAARAGNESAAEFAHRALAECERGREAVARDEREAFFKSGQTLAKRAVALDERNAQAHFALFCNKGELMRLDGESVSSLFALRSLMAELDRAIALDPEYDEALTAKGTLLVRLPRLLGGNPEKGEALLRQVVARDPNAFASRLTLADRCVARGDRAEALALATRALEIARAQGKPDKIAKAESTLAELGAGR